MLTSMEGQLTQEIGKGGYFTFIMVKTGGGLTFYIDHKGEPNFL